jgi:hypothetical protein
VVALAVLASALALLPALRAGFVWDDALLVRDNRHLAGPGALRWALTHALWDVEAGGGERVAARYYRPAVTALLVALRALAGQSAWPFHAAVLAAHLVAVALAGRFFRRALGERPLAVAAATGLFALHATRVEAVCPIVGLTDVVMALPCLLALTRALPRGAPGPTATAGRDAVASAALTLLALAAKETGLALPIALYAVGFATRPAGRARRIALAAHAGASALAAAAYLGLRARYMPLGPLMNAPPPIRHALLALETIGRYAGLIAWPFPLTSLRAALRLDAGGALVVSAPWAALGAVLLGLTLVAVARRVWRRSGTIAAGVGICAAFLLPVLNLRWTGLLYLVADRMLYVPMLGVGLALGALVARAGVAARRPVAMALAGLALAHSLALVVRGLDYRDEWAFWSAERAMHPGAPAVLSGLASAELERGRTGRAFLYLEQALAAMPGFATEDRLAAETYLTIDVALRVVPDSDRDSLESALAFDRALRDPRAGEARAVLLGHVFRLDRRRIAGWLAREDAYVAMNEALLLSRLGRADAARATADDALARCARRCVDAHLNAALIHARGRDWDAAQRLAVQARTLDPGLPAPRELLASIAAARAHAAEASALGASPATRALVEAEIDLLFAAPEASRAWLAQAPPSPRRAMLLARVALAEFDFATADEIVDQLRPGAPSSAAPAFDSLARYEAAQRRRADGLEREISVAR